MQHGFLRAPDGTFTTFDAPGGSGTSANSINPAGAITGYYFVVTLSPFRIVFHGFLRAADGTFTTFDVPGAGTGPFQGTGPFGVAINPVGTTAGTYTDAGGTIHGFLRAGDGTITAFDPPGSVSTFPASINPAGAITGSYTDAGGTTHGFLRIP